MIIRGNTVGTTMPRADYAETNPKSAAFIKNKPDAAIQKAQDTADNAVTAAGNAHTAADNAQSAADNAQTTANNALPKAGGTMTGPLNMGSKQITNVADPTSSTDGANKGYVDAKRKTFTATLTLNGWSSAAPYTQTISISGILATDMPHISPVYSATLATAITQKENWAMVCKAVTADGSITFTCFEEKPSVNLSVQLEVNR